MKRENNPMWSLDSFTIFFGIRSFNHDYRETFRIKKNDRNWYSVGWSLTWWDVETYLTLLLWFTGRCSLLLLHLTVYYIILNFEDPERVSFWKHCWKRRKCWYPAFSPFSTLFSTLSKIEIIFVQTVDLLYAYGFNLVLLKFVVRLRVHMGYTKRPWIVISVKWSEIKILGWLVGCIGFNATVTAKAISWWSVMHMCFLAFSHQY